MGRTNFADKPPTPTMSLRHPPNNPGISEGRHFDREMQIAVIRLAMRSSLIALFSLAAFLAASAPVGAASEFSTLYQFQAAPDGARPSGRLIFDASGALYGTTRYGGDTENGTVFKLTPP